MGIRLKIALGFILLTVGVISAVSFWAAQSLGFSIDRSDFEKLKSFKSEVLNYLDQEQKNLNLTCEQIAGSFSNLNMLEQSEQDIEVYCETLKNNLDLDWLLIDKQSKSTSIKNKPRLSLQPTVAVPKRLAQNGPYSHHAYLVASSKIYKNTRITIATRAKISNLNVPLLCLFDNNGVLERKIFRENIDFAKRLKEGQSTVQLNYEGELYRVRAFSINNGIGLIVGYPAQRAVISRPDIDQLMLRLSILQVIGLLILGYFLGRKLLEPLRVLGSGIEKVAQGDWKQIPLDQAPMVDCGDEIEAVAQSFNKMVDELAMAQSRLIEVQKELAKKDKLAALGRFSAGIAHEINNPLGTILANAGLLKEAIEKGAEVSVDEIEEIVEEVKRCKNIITTLRTYTGQTRPNLVKKDFEQTFNHLTEFLINNKEFSSIVFKLKNRAKGSLLVDEQGLKRVMINLCKNSVDAMKRNKFKEIVIEAYNLNEGFVINFQDNGEGFECDPELIFEPLFTTKIKGTGLGLIICQAIVEGHGGKIKVKRCENRTIFEIMLPGAKEKIEVGE
ncbi:MAG: sensor histidine kinase [Candidatus Rifleibacteriota bacterium]